MQVTVSASSSSSSNTGGVGGAPPWRYDTMIELKNIVKSYPMGKRESEGIAGS